MNVLDLFSGIGGFSLGLERAGFNTVAFCEIDLYCRKVLNKHWPDVPIYVDVRELSGERLRADGITDIGVITGGFPCQDISVAGKRKGITGERSGLWGELHRIIDDIQPEYAIMENVSALISGDRGRWFGRVLGDLAEIGYDAEWHCIPASAIGAPHQRDRIWIIAYPFCSGGGGNKTQSSDWCTKTQRKSLSKKVGQACTNNTQPLRQTMADNIINAYGWPSEPDMGRVANGIPRRVDRIRGLGNAVVPQIPELIGRAILSNNT